MMVEELLTSEADRKGTTKDRQGARTHTQMQPECEYMYY